MTRRTYRLDSAAQHYLDSSLLHLIVRGSDVVGRYGRYGVLRGTLDGSELTASLTDGPKQGWFRASFDAMYDAFEGTCAYGREPANECRIAGSRAEKKRTVVL